MHKSSLLVVLCLALNGCISVTEEYYLPEDQEYVYEGKTCGSFPYGGYYAALAEDVAISISATPEKGNLYLHFQYILNGENSTFRMNEKFIRIAAPDRGHREIDVSQKMLNYQSIDPTLQIRGDKKYELKMSKYEISDFSPKNFTLTLPPLVVNGSGYILPTIKFRHVRNKGVMTCVQ